MEFAKQTALAIQQAIQTKQAELDEAQKNRVLTSSSMADTEWLEMPRAGRNWKRLVLILGVVENHATTGAILNYLEELRDRIAKEKYEEYRRAAGNPPNPAPKSKGKNKNLPQPMAKGKALSRSTAGYPFPKEPDSCPHDPESLSNPRGGRGGLKWLTCLMCGSRWERVEEDILAPLQSDPTAAAPQAILTALAKAQPGQSIRIPVKELPGSDQARGSSCPNPPTLPPSAKRRMEQFTIEVPTVVGTDLVNVTREVHDRYTKLDAYFTELNQTIPSQSVCIQAMMAAAQSPEDLKAVNEFYAMKFQFVDAV